METGFDPDRAQAFAGRMLGALNEGALCLMTSIGHRSGLFDVMSDLGAATSSQIATAARLNERYVREWLGAMVTSGVVLVDPASNRFHLPAEHAAFLTRAAKTDNIALFTQYIAVLANVEDDVLDCFIRGGGVPYAKYPRMHAVMAEDLTVLSALESHILPLVPGLAAQLKRGIAILDLGCGSGRALIRLAELFPTSRFVGMDFSLQAVEVARDEAASKGLENVVFEVRDLSDFDTTAEPETFDFVTTFDAIHDQIAPLRVLQGIHRTLAGDGAYLMQEIKGASHPHDNIGHALGTFLYTVSCMHCMTVSLANGGEGLGAMWGEEKTREYLARAGFRSVEKHELPHDLNNNWYVVRK